MAGQPEEPPEKPDFQRIFDDALSKGGFPDLPEAGSYIEVAIAQNEIYECLRKAGFATGQALYLTAVAVTGTPGTAPNFQNE
jgi:hypothetical protein